MAGIHLVVPDLCGLVSFVSKLSQNCPRYPTSPPVFPGVVAAVADEHELNRPTVLGLQLDRSDRKDARFARPLRNVRIEFLQRIAFAFIRITNRLHCLDHRDDVQRLFLDELSEQARKSQPAIERSRQRDRVHHRGNRQNEWVESAKISPRPVRAVSQPKTSRSRHLGRSVAMVSSLTRLSQKPRLQESVSLSWHTESRVTVMLLHCSLVFFKTRSSRPIPT